jgi:hypothetical protein
MKNTVLTLIVIAIVGTGAWYLLSTGRLMLPKQASNYPIIKDIVPTPTPSLAPKSDIDQELNQTDQDLNKTNPSDFSGEAILDTKLGL